VSGEFDQRLEALVEQFNQKRGEAGQTRRLLQEIEGTATSTRQTVRVTVGAFGDVKSIEFPTSAYHQMAPKELSDTLMTTIAEAKAKAMAKVDESIDSPFPGVSASALVRGEFDMSQVLPENPIPDEIRDLLNRFE
jgi:DNA-binding protein YbaB